MTVKIISWNVNGIRAVMKKDKQGKRDTNKPSVLHELISAEDPDILAFQETKCPEDLHVELGEKYVYQRILASRTKKGYSGVAIFSKSYPLRELIDFPENEEGRVLALEFETYYVINAYVPNSKPDLSRLDYRVNIWEKSIREYIIRLQKKKPVIYVADFNVAPTEMDLANPQANMKSHGFTLEERGAFAELCDTCKLLDAFRVKHPKEKKWSWFSNFAQSRARNVGWRIDHTLVSRDFADKIKRADILGEYYGSDHVPVLVELNI